MSEIPEEVWQIGLDYPTKPASRWGHGNPTHERIEQIIARRVPEYRKLLESFLPHRDKLHQIPLNRRGDGGAYWLNGWLPVLDCLAIYCLIAEMRPHQYVEVGAGNSTLFAKKAIENLDLSTEITSIDPGPQDDIGPVSDRWIASPLEDVELSLFDSLGANDLVFFDGSHRSLPNSDVTVAFLDILPKLESGVVVGFHDIFLPDDYPPEWWDRFYSEQYLLAVHLLAEGARSEIVLPSWYVSHDEDLMATLDPILEPLAREGLETHGGSFWLRMS